MTTNRGTKRRSLRVTDALWEAYAAACAYYRQSVSDDLRAHMEAKVHNHEQAVERDRTTEGSKGA